MSSHKQLKKIKAYKKTNGICFICGKQISENSKYWTLEHYIPRAIYKWVSDTNLKKQLESLDNLFITHKKCNLSKDSELPNINKINKLQINDHLKANLLNLYKSVEQTILQYQLIKQSTWEIQNHQCFFCHKYISLNKAVLRRKNNHQQRSKYNAMCLCLKCSMKTTNTQYKHNMVNQKTKQQVNTM